MLYLLSGQKCVVEMSTTNRSLLVGPERINRFTGRAARLGLLRPRGVFSAQVGRHADKKLDPVLLDNPHLGFDRLQGGATKGLPHSFDDNVP
jgi:hypothetical protein